MITILLLHHIINPSISINSNISNLTPTLDFKKADLLNIKCDLMKINWNYILCNVIYSSNELLNIFIKTVTNIINKHTPYRKNKIFKYPIHLKKTIK